MLEARDLQVSLASDAGLVRALDGLQLSLARGETFALVGESGCGKSTTALALMRLLPDNGWVSRGALTLDGQDLLALPERAMQRVRGGRVALIFQDPSTSLNPVMRIGDQIVEAIELHTPHRGPAARARALEWLARVGIPDPQRRIDDYPFRLSGGQKQRVMIAMALAAEPDFLIADEPTTALDVSVQAQILDLIRDLQRERHLGMLLITHDLAVVSQMAHRVALMYAGQIVELAPAGDFFASPRHPYAQMLLQALPEAARRHQPLAAILGTVPLLSQSFTGCRFAPRCDRVQALCDAEPPTMRSLGSGRHVRCVATSARRPTVPAREEPASTTCCASVAAGDEALLSVRDLQVAFPGRRTGWRRPAAEFQAVSGVSFDLAAGQTMALVGESGSGKTTTGKAILQLLRRQARVSGEAMFQGQDLFQLDSRALTEARRHIQVIFQDPFASLNPRLRVAEALEEGLIALRPDLDARQRRQRLHALLEQVGLRRDVLTRWPHEFSGGQRQRIAIARALAVEPRLIVCDEPTSALDVSVQAQILNLLRELQRAQGLAYLFITHNLGVVEYLADQIAVMRAGRIVEQGPCHRVLRQPTDSYTRSLLAAVPRLTSPNVKFVAD